MRRIRKERKDTHLSFKLDRPLRERLEAVAAAEDLTVSTMLRRIVRRFVERKEPAR
jgi:predicted transcriptional regulator